MDKPIRVFMITSEWPTPDKPHQVPFIVQQVKFLRKLGVDLHLFPFRGGKQPARYARAWQRAQEEIANGKYDLVHAQWGQSGLLSLPKHIPLVVTFRGDDLKGIIGSSGHQNAYGVVLKNLSKLVARAADQVIVVSKSLAEELPDKDYEVIPSGLDLDLFCPMPQEQARQQLGLVQNKQYVLFAGAAENPRKRFALAQEAVKILKQEMDVDLLVASKVTHEQVPLYMNAANALLLTSIHEGSPNVVKEALAVNLPVVSTDVGDVRERISPIPGCAMIEDDQPEAIAATLRKVLKQGEKIQARQTVLDLDENKLSNKVMDLYAKVIEGKQNKNNKVK